MPIRDDDPRPAYQQLADELRQAIATGEYQVGDRLPSTRELSESHGIALMTVRAAVGVLEDENLVMPRQGRGVFVVGIPEPPEPPGPAGPGDLAAMRETLQETMTLLQGINDRLDRMETAQTAGTRPARDAGLGAERDPLDEALDSLKAIDTALARGGAAGATSPRTQLDPHIDPGPPPPEPDAGIGL